MSLDPKSTRLAPTIYGALKIHGEAVQAIDIIESDFSRDQVTASKNSFSVNLVVCLEIKCVQH